MEQADVALDEFAPGVISLICRWRIANGALPLANRHIRALGARYINEKRISRELVVWAKQHIEWTLKEGSIYYPNGVLMLVVDEEGKAAMAVGEYEPLPDTAAASLIERARLSAREAEATGVAPETLWATQGDRLLISCNSDQPLSGASSFIFQLAKTLGIPLSHTEDLIDLVFTGDISQGNIFLVSDEHGVVAPLDSASERICRLRDSYTELLNKTK